MPAQLAELDREQAELLDFVDELVRLAWTPAPDRRHAVHGRLCAQFVLDGDRLAEVLVPLPDHESSLVTAMRSRFGHDTEIATPRRRVHRWTVNGHEVLLDSCCGAQCHLLVD
ncbi:MAG TPA: hypothetical protein VHO26_13150 [Propionibacteriaceae bacterium]|nr:hypothetical protein [Propionibacteriaceae bacterium]HEX2858402.1 hypothetical protein [Propionibacteriaceae bacterium]